MYLLTAVESSLASLANSGPHTDGPSCESLLWSSAIVYVVCGCGVCCLHSFGTAFPLGSSTLLNRVQLVVLWVKQGRNQNLCCWLWKADRLVCDYERIDENLCLVWNFELLSKVVKSHTYVANNASHMCQFFKC